MTTRQARRQTPSRAGALAAAALALLLGGCTGVELTNPQPAREYAKETAPPGSVYTGWRVFQDKCAACHGAAATGAGAAPDLLPRVRAMGERQFAGLVLQRYDWTTPTATPRTGAPPSEAEIDDVMARRTGALTMPAWQGEPRVTAHVVDLYAWLSARAAGTQPPGPPAR